MVPYDERGPFLRDNKHIRHPLIVLASSGMLSFGPAKGWCKKVISDKKCAIVFCGFTPEETLGSEVKDTSVSKVRIDGVEFKKQAKIYDFHSFSSHMQRDSLIDYYSTIDTPKVVLVHGDPEAKQSLMEAIRNRRQETGNSAEIICAEGNLVIDL